jgi:hypothetical protein
MMKKQNINREVFIYRDSPNEGDEPGSKKFLIWGEIGGRLVRKALSAPTLEFITKFAENSKPEKDLMNAWVVKDSKGAYIFDEKTGGVLRCWSCNSDTSAQIDPYYLDMYRRLLGKGERNYVPANISSDNIDTAKMQKTLVLMFRKYVKFL